METVINLKIRDEYSKPQIGMGISFDSNTIVLDLYTSSNTNFSELLREESLRKMLKNELDYMKNSKIQDDDDTFDDSIETVNNLLNSNINISSTISEIYLESTSETAEYVKNNPIIKSYPLILNEEFSINNEDLASIDEYFTTLENLKVCIDGNQQRIGIIDYKNTVNAINEIVSKIKKYNLSPLEQVMYAYDLVRDRVYIHEGKNEDYNISRDLSSVLSGDKIVCVGFANILDKVLENLDIKSDMVFLLNKGKRTGHARNVIYIKDDKYGVEAMYYLDPTWDSKRTNTDTNYLNSYTYFCRTKDEIDTLSLMKGHDYVDRRFDEFKENTVWEFEDIVENDGIKAVPKSMVYAFNQISEFIDGKNLISHLVLSDDHMVPEFIRNSFNYDEVFERLCDYRSIMYDNYLSAEQLLKLLINVRKIEFYENPEKYPYDIESIKKIVVDRKLSDKKAMAESLFLSVLFGNGDSLNRKLSQENFDEISKKEEYEKTIAQVKLAKVLRKVYEQKIGGDENVGRKSL